MSTRVKTRVWKRLRLVEVLEQSVEERMEMLIEKLDGAKDLTRDDRSSAAMYLRLFLQTPKAMQAIKVQRGRPSTHVLQWRAVADYLVRRELGGEGSSRRALEETATAWGKKPEDISGYITKHRKVAEMLIDSYCSGRDRRETLPLILKDLKELDVGPIK